ncbi:gamma-glutamylcyclotransferase [Myxococcota bacterium]|nr:gamma-glutamylcyclotransferase [Myxococcota bacterium]
MSARDASDGSEVPGPSTLFVYGTLMRGEARHDLVASARRIEPATIAGRLWDTGRGYPALVDRSTPEDARVHGEALTFEPAELARLLPRLDDYEGYHPCWPASSLYLRVTREITLEDGTTLDAWVYVMPAKRERELVESGARRIPSGAWKKALQSPAGL